MNRECTTHHHACDCREARFRGLESDCEVAIIFSKEQARVIEALKAELDAEQENAQGFHDQLTELEAELAALREAAQAAADATDRARKQYGGTLSFEATIKLDKMAALLPAQQGEGE